MQTRNLLAAAGLFLLTACSSDPSGFSIASGPLKPDELSLSGYAATGLRAQAFDVVSQDPNAGNAAGVTGKIQPNPAELLSSYAAQKFRATGGPYNARFVIKQAALQVTQSAAPKKESSFWSMDYFGGDDAKTQMTLNVAVNVVASLPDGTGATITATTTQSEKSGFGSASDNREVYMKLMNRALAALDGEIARQLPAYFANITAP
jgi:hypothetical protein